MGKREAEIRNEDREIQHILQMDDNEFGLHDVVFDCINPHTNEPLLTGEETSLERYQIYREADFDYDADVSFTAMAAARKIYPFVSSDLLDPLAGKEIWEVVPQEKIKYRKKNGELHTHNQDELMYELRSTNPDKKYVYRGDTMNSAATMIREYHRMFGRNEKLPEEAEIFLDIYHTLGNFILLPYAPGYSLNGARGIGKSHDFFDLFLRAVYRWFMEREGNYKPDIWQEWTLQTVFGTQEKADFYAAWLTETFLPNGASGVQENSREAAVKGWRDFVEANFLQDYVKIEADGSFGEPKMVWKANELGYLFPEVFENYWATATDRIIRRNLRLYEALHGRKI